MNNIHPDTIAEIMKALDEGVSVDALARRFPEYRAEIAGVEEARQLLLHAAAAIPEPITKPLGARLQQAEGPVESPFVINSLFFSMNYKIVLPVLVLGLVVVGGTVFLSGNGGQVAEIPNEAPFAEVDKIPENEASGGAQPGVAKPQTVPSQVATNVSVNDVLTGFSTDAASDQLAYADDGVSTDMFAQSELSGFDSDAYDY